MKKTIISIIAISAIFSASQVEVVSVKKLPENQNYTLTINSEKEVMGLQFDLKYNPNELKFNGATSLLDGFTFECKDKGDGQVRGLMFSMSGDKLNIQDISSLIEFDFKPAPNFIGDGKVEFTNLIIAGENGESIDVVLPSFTVINENVLPVRTELNSAFPNPFNPETTISYEVGSESLIDISILNLKGQMVEELVHEVVQPGQHSINWNAKNMPSGIYMVRMKTPYYSATQKIILLK